MLPKISIDKVIFRHMASLGRNVLVAVEICTCSLVLIWIIIGNLFHNFIGYINPNSIQLFDW